MGVHRSRAQIARHRKLIAAMYLRGSLQAEIAKSIGISQPTVSRDIKALHKQWIGDAKRDFNEAVGKELAKIDVLEQEYWQGWLRSTSDVRKQLVWDQKQGDWMVEVIELLFVREGNPRFLDGIRECIKDRCRLLGSQMSDGGIPDMVIKVIGGIDLDKDI